MLDALFEFLVMIKDFVMSIIDGMATLLQSLYFLTSVPVTAVVWMPEFLFSLCMVSMTLLVVLRIVGR